jgi:hypothetical protein
MSIDVVTTIDNSQAILEEMTAGIRTREKSSAERAADIARRVVRRRTGNLASTIEAHEDGSVTAGGDRAPYAGMVHDGSARNHPANPFMTQAFEGERDHFEESMKEI